MTVNLNGTRIGLLVTPITPLWVGSVTSYTITDTALTLVASTISGDISLLVTGLFVDAHGEQVRIKAITDLGGGNVSLSLAENGVAFVASDAVTVYNVRYPTTKFQRLLTNVATVAGDTSHRITAIVLAGVNANNAETIAGGFRLYYTYFATGRIIFYPDSARDDGNKVARSHYSSAGHTEGIEARNNSGISGTITLASQPSVDENGSVDITSQKLYKDYSILFSSLGATQTDWSHEEQRPVPIVTPECAVLDVGENETFDASKSFATYWGYPGPSTSRVQATIPATGYAWDGGYGAVITGASNQSTVTIRWTVAGFRYLKLTITDSNGVTSVRHIPVWIGLAATETLTTSDAFRATWAINKGWQFDVEIQSPPTILRHSLVLAYDLDIQQPVFLGYIWPASYEYNVELNRLSFTAFSDYAYLQQCFHYPFIITGSKGDPIEWNYLDMSSTCRLVNYLLQWHSNYTEIANAAYNVQVAGIPTAGAAEDVLEYIRDFVAGTIFDQLEFVANSGMRAVYGGRLGGFRAIPDWLHEASITTAAADLVTLALAASQIWEPVNKMEGVPTVSDIRVSGWYYTPALVFTPIIARSPAHPEQWGKPFEVGGVIATSTAQVQLWAGREIAIRNNANTYTVKPKIDMDLSLYQMLDIPSEPRMVVQSERWQFNADALGWEVELEAKTFGTTADSTLEPYAPPPIVGPPIVDPIPPPVIDPPERVAFISNGTQLAVTHTFDTASPTWFSAAPSLPAGASIYGFVVSPGKEEAWCLTGGGADLTQVGVHHCANITVDSPSFSLVYSQAQAATDGVAALTALGFASPAFGEMGSMASGADGTLIVVERKWSGFADRAPSCAFVTVNGGGAWSVNVPSGAAAHRFWAELYIGLYGCHQIEWDGSQYIIAGTTGYAFFHWFQATATSGNGTSWTIAEASAAGYEYPRSYASGHSLFDLISGSGADELVLLPTTNISQISYTSIYYHHFDHVGVQCYLHESATPPYTRNYLNVGGIDVVDSNDVYGAGARIGGAALKDATTYVLVPIDSVAAGMVVCERSGGVNTDKTGNLLTALGGPWAGGPTAHLDNCQVEIT